MVEKRTCLIKEGHQSWPLILMRAPSRGGVSSVERASEEPTEQAPGPSAYHEEASTYDAAGGLSADDVQALASLGVGAAVLATKGYQQYKKWLYQRQIDALTDKKDLEEPLKLKPGSYESEQLNVLTAEFYRIRQDFSDIIAEKQVLAQTGNAQSVLRFLQFAKNSLEKKDSNLSLLVMWLGFADVASVRMYTGGMIRVRADEVAFTLSQWSDPRPKAAAERIRKALDNSSDDSEETIRACLIDGIQVLHQLERSAHQSDTLRLPGLKWVRWAISLTLVGLIAVSPILLNFPPPTGRNIVSGVPITGNATWPVNLISSFPLVFQVYLTVLGIAVLGATGGALSGLLTARRSRGQLRDARSERIKLTMKPIVGALVAVTLYLLLSWNALTGIAVVNGGTYLYIAVIAGFSERFFLRLLSANPEPEVRASGTGLDPERARQTSELVSFPVSFS